MISIKRYLDSGSGPSQPGVAVSMLDAYLSALTAMGICAGLACPSAGDGLRRALTGLGLGLSDTAGPELVASTEALVTQELQQWGDQAEASLQQKANDVKELLVILARTAATFTGSDERYANRFETFTTRLEQMADLEDLTQLRTSLVQSAAELKSCVEEMSRSNRSAVAQLQAEVVTYQGKLKEAENVASRDALTGLFNHSRVVSRIDYRITIGQPFCVAVIDLDGFKAINDRLGHSAGDDLLTQFSADLRTNARAGDLVGRWGGDEFMVVLNGAGPEARAHIERVRKWVVGDYTVTGSNGPHKVHLDASIGFAEWVTGMKARQLIDPADAGMYREKKGGRR